MASTKKTIPESNDGETFEVDKGVALDNIESMASSLEKIILNRNDGKTFEVDKAVALDNIEAMASSSKKIILNRNDGETFEVDKAVALDNIEAMASSSKKIILKSNDGKNFEVDRAVALQSQVIKYPIEEDLADTCFLLPNVKGDILSKVIKYCKMHSDDNVPDYQLKSFDAQFVNVEKGLLFDLVLAADYLEIESLLDLTCKAVGDKTVGKTLEEIRTFFDIADFDEDGEDPWALG